MWKKTGHLSVQVHVESEGIKLSYNGVLHLIYLHTEVCYVLSVLGEVFKVQIAILNISPYAS